MMHRVRLICIGLGICFLLVCLYRIWTDRRVFYSHISPAATKAFQSAQPRLSTEPQTCPTLHIDEDFVAALRQRMVDGRNEFFGGKRRLYVQHQHKCGGSTLCRYFKASGLRVPKVKNCNGDPWMWPLVHGSRKDLQTLYRSTSFEVLFNEREFFSEDVPEDEFVYITSARDPVPRMISSMLQDWQDLPLDSDGVVKNLSLTLAEFIDHGIDENSAKDAPLNLQTLHLAGEKWGEQKEDWPNIYRLVLKRLKIFSFTIPTESLSEGLAYIRAFFGLKIVMPKGREHWNARGANEQLEFLEKHDPQLVRKIQRDNFYDNCLYRQVRELWKVQKKIVEEEAGSVQV